MSTKSIDDKTALALWKMINQTMKTHGHLLKDMPWFVKRTDQKESVEFKKAA